MFHFISGPHWLIQNKRSCTHTVLAGNSFIRCFWWPLIPVYISLLHSLAGQKIQTNFISRTDIRVTLHLAALKDKCILCRGHDGSVEGTRQLRLNTNKDKRRGDNTISSETWQNNPASSCRWQQWWEVWRSSRSNRSCFTSSSEQPRTCKPSHYKWT